jgi:hypothetical protein
MDGLVRSLAIGVGWNVDDNGLQQANRQTDGLISSADRAENEVNQLGQSGEQAGNKLTRGFRSAKNSLQSGMGVLREYKYELTAMAAAGVTGMFQLASRAGDAQETVNKFRVVFGDFADESRNWASNYADQIGRSEYATLDWLNSFQDVLVPMGLARDEAATLSQEMVTLAADLGSFNNVATDRAAQAMQSAMVGNHEAVRSLGIQLNENRLDALALAEGYEENFAQLDALTKMELRYQEMIRQSDDAVGDATRTALEFNNQQLAFKGNLRDTAIALGNQYIPSMNEGLIATNDFLDAFQESEWVGPTARIGGLATGLGLVGAAVAWLGGPGLIAVAKFGGIVGVATLIVEDLISFFQGRDSMASVIVDNFNEITNVGQNVNEFLDKSKTQWENFSNWLGKKDFIPNFLEQGKKQWNNFKEWWDGLEIGLDFEMPKIDMPEINILGTVQSGWNNLVDWIDEKTGIQLPKIDMPEINILGTVQSAWNVMVDWWEDVSTLSFDFEMPNIGGFIDEQVQKLPDWSKKLLGIENEVVEKESKEIQNNNSTNINNTEVNENITINVDGSKDPKEVSRLIDQKLKTRERILAGEVGVNL